MNFENYFDFWSITLLVVMFIFLLLELIFYVYYYRKAYFIQEENKEPNTFRGKISVIISAENESDRLSKCLPLILEQDYKDFEVIVINNGSTDETDTLIENLSLKYSNLYCTFLPKSRDKEFGRKKLALTIGAKAAKGDFLLFTEPYVVPCSDKWISSMANCINDNTEIVLGVNVIDKRHNFYNIIARYNNLLFTMQYASEALRERPFTGVYRNLALRKETFFKHKGFASALALENSEDLFINQICTGENTAICINTEGTTLAVVDNYMLWQRIMKNYSVAKSLFKNKSLKYFSIEKIIRVFFYLLFFALVIYSLSTLNFIVLGIAFVLFCIKTACNYYIVYKANKIFANGTFSFLLPLIDFVHPIYCMKFKSRHRSLKAKIED